MHFGPYAFWPLLYFVFGPLDRAYWVEPQARHLFVEPSSRNQSPESQEYVSSFNDNLTCPCHSLDVDNCFLCSLLMIFSIITGLISPPTGP